MSKLKLKYIPFKDVFMGNRMREYYDETELTRLMESIKQHGVQQPPTVLETEEGKYLLVAGGRRYLSLKRLFEADELKTHYPDGKIPALIAPKGSTGDKTMEMEIIENLIRSDMTPYEYMKGIGRYHDLQMQIYGEKTSTSKSAKGWSRRDTAEALSISHTTANSYLDMYDLLVQLKQLDTIDSDIKKVGTFKELKAHCDKLKAEFELLAMTVQNQAALQRLADLQDPEGGDTFGKLSSKGVDLGVKLEELQPMSGLKTSEARNAQVAQVANRLIDRFILGDFFEKVKNVPDKKMDLIICDTPFAIELPDVKGSAADNDEYQEWTKDDYPSKINEVLAEVTRVAKDDAWLLFWYAPHPWQGLVLSALQQHGWTVRNMPAIWVKPGGQTLRPEYNLAHNVEYFYYARRGKAEINKKGRTTTFIASNVAYKPHPTTKPIRLSMEIIETFVSPTNTPNVFIPFLGSGWDILACYNLGIYNAFGFELSGYFKDQFALKVNKELRAGGLFE